MGFDPHWSLLTKTPQDNYFTLVSQLYSTRIHSWSDLFSFYHMCFLKSLFLLHTFMFLWYPTLYNKLNGSSWLKFTYILWQTFLANIQSLNTLQTHSPLTVFHILTFIHLYINTFDLGLFPLMYNLQLFTQFSLLNTTVIFD